MSINIKCPWPGWEVVRELGKGGFGTVYEIRRDLYGTEKAAMKVITVPESDEVITDYYNSGYDNKSIGNRVSEDIRKIREEYNNMKSFKDSPNIVSCDDFAVDDLPDGIRKRVCIRMELLTPLDKYLPKGNADIKEEQVIQIGRDICEALKECERQNIVHRDIKPSNILVLEKGRFKLGDFGIARTLDHTTKVTRAGTWEYISPEIFKMEKSNKRADIYSLGLVLYWLLNNRKFPFYPMDRIPSAEEEQEAFSKRISGETLPDPVRGNRKLKEVILKACAYKPEDRYDSAARMQEALTQALGYTGSSETSGNAGSRSQTDNQTGNGSSQGETQGNSWDDTGSIDERYWNHNQGKNEKRDDKTRGNFGKKEFEPKKEHEENMAVETSGKPPFYPVVYSILLFIGASICFGVYCFDKWDVFYFDGRFHNNYMYIPIIILYIIQFSMLCFSFFIPRKTFDSCKTIILSYIFSSINYLVSGLFYFFDISDIKYFICAADILIVVNMSRNIYQNIKQKKIAISEKASSLSLYEDMLLSAGLFLLIPSVYLLVYGINHAWNYLTLFRWLGLVFVPEFFLFVDIWSFFIPKKKAKYVPGSRIKTIIALILLICDCGIIIVCCCFCDWPGWFVAVPIPVIIIIIIIINLIRHLIRQKKLSRTG